MPEEVAQRASPQLLPCHHYDAGRCRSCTWLEVPYADQLARKEAHARRLVPAAEWLAPCSSPVGGFRNKAKMVVTGTADAPRLGILGPEGTGVDLRDCPLHEPGLVASMPVLAAFVGRARLAPYDVAARRGELKHLIATHSPDGELMVRFVLRSTEALARIRKHLPWLLDTLAGGDGLPRLRVASVNLQPEHKAVLEGPEEIVLTESSAQAAPVATEPSTRLAGTLPMRVNDVTLHLRPNSFFQTNTRIAGELYRSARDWVADLDLATGVDLYCGVGGFALHLAGSRSVPGPAFTGIESSPEAVASATASAQQRGARATFTVGDATSWTGGSAPVDLVVVNPPRRGIGPVLTAAIEASGVPHLLYSSCHAESLARDLAALPSYSPVRARLFDMFPNTAHHEVLVLLSR